MSGWLLILHVPGDDEGGGSDEICCGSAEASPAGVEG